MHRAPPLGRLQRPTESKSVAVRFIDVFICSAKNWRVCHLHIRTSLCWAEIAMGGNEYSVIVRTIHSVRRHHAENKDAFYSYIWHQPLMVEFNSNKSLITNGTAGHIRKWELITNESGSYVRKRPITRTNGSGRCVNNCSPITNGSGRYINNRSRITNASGWYIISTLMSKVSLKPNVVRRQYKV